MSGQQESIIDFDSIGRSILPYLDVQLALIFGIVVVLVLTGLSHLRGGRPNSSDIVRASFAIVTIYTGLLVGTVFLFTRPPAINKISEDTIVIIGFIVLILHLFAGIKEINTALFGNTRGGDPNERRKNDSPEEQ